jgi:beta-lactam-binding protein with PASTA domain
MAQIPTQTKKDLFTHIAILASLFLVLFFGFFFVYLPWSTHHGETIKVPNLKGLSADKMEELIDASDLTYEVSDCTYTADKPPLTVLSQYPLPNALVKSGRKIYITINSETPPTIKLPTLVGLSVRSAEQQLFIAGLRKGIVHEVNDPRVKEVIEVQALGRKIEAGASIPKGTMVDLYIGNGMANVDMEMPDFVGKPMDEVTIILAGMNLKVGKVVYEANEAFPAGTVFKQTCATCEGTSVKPGDLIDLWVVGGEDQNQ